MCAASSNNDGDFYSGVRWSAASKYGMQVIRFTNSILLARILAPEMFGIIALAAVVTGFAEVFTKLGFGVAIVQQKVIDPLLLNTIFWANLLVCAVLNVLVAASAPLVAHWFDKPELTLVLVVMSLTIGIGSLSTVSISLLTRKMEFKRLAIRELIGVIIYGVVSIVAAIAGAGVWSLVIGTIASSVSQFLLIVALESYRPQFEFDADRLRTVLKFGLNLTGANLFNYFSRNADNAIIGYWLGSASLGIYSVAYKLMTLPREAISQVLIRVMLPKLSRLQDDDMRLGEVYIKACAAIALVTFPLMAGLMVLANPFVHVALGDKWTDCIPVIQILAMVGALQSVNATRNQVLIAKGLSRTFLYLTVADGVLAIAGFLIGVRWGIVGISVSYLCVNLVLVPISFLVVFSKINSLTVERFSRALYPCVMATLLMAVAVAATYQWLYSLTPNRLTHLAISTPVGIVVYTLVILAVRPAEIRPIFRLLRNQS